MTADEYLGSNFIGYEKQLAKMAEAYADDKDNVPLYRHSSSPSGLHNTNELVEQRRQILQELDDLLEVSKQMETSEDKLMEEVVKVAEASQGDHLPLRPGVDDDHTRPKRVGPVGARASTIRLLRGLKNIDIKPTDVPSVMDDDDLDTDDDSDGGDEIKAAHEDDDYLDSDGDVDDAGEDADGGYKPKEPCREHFTENGGNFDTLIQPEKVDAISAEFAGIVDPSTFMKISKAQRRKRLQPRPVVDAPSPQKGSDQQTEATRSAISTMRPHTKRGISSGH